MSRRPEYTKPLLKSNVFIGKIDRYFRFVRKRKHFVVVGFYGHGSKFSVFCNERRAWKTKFERYCANVVVSKAVAIFSVSSNIYSFM